MATVTTMVRFNSKTNSKTKVMFRLRGTGVNVYYTSDLIVDESQWDYKSGTLFKNILIVGNTDRKTFLNKLEEIKSIILKVYNGRKDDSVVNNEWLKKQVEKELKHPKENVTYERVRNFFQWFDEFIDKGKYSEIRKRNLRVVKRCLQRFELYHRIKHRNYKLDIYNLTVEELYLIEDFILNEHEYLKDFPYILEEIPESRIPKGRGENTKIDMMKKIHTFVKWVIKWDDSVRDPFLRFEIGTEVYGTPIYINLNERKQIYNYDFSYNKEKEWVRDVFVFQCVVGCRVGDLYKMSKGSYQNGFVEYIQGKTKEGNPKTVRLPLNKIGTEIMNKYSDVECKTIIPFPRQDVYNELIKEVLKEAGITRTVTVLNQRTRQEEHKPIYQVVSTHMARRTFIGNTFKIVKDKTLVSSMTGHTPNSRAFNRYVDIDDELKLEVIKLIE